MNKYIELTNADFVDMSFTDVVDAYYELLAHHIEETKMLYEKLKEARKNANATE